MTDHPLTDERIEQFRDRHIDPYLYAQEIFDAGREHERANPEDDRPWEPLDGRPVRVGDEVRRELKGTTTTAVVGRVDDEGDPWAAEGGLIGVLEYGTWYVRRPAPELPPEDDGVVLVPADGHKAITTANGRKFSRLTYSAELSMWYGPRLDVGPWEDDIQKTAASYLTPDTWKPEAAE